MDRWTLLFFFLHPLRLGFKSNEWCKSKQCRNKETEHRSLHSLNTGLSCRIVQKELGLKASYRDPIKFLGHFYESMWLKLPFSMWGMYIEVALFISNETCWVDFLLRIFKQTIFVGVFWVSLHLSSHCILSYVGNQKQPLVPGYHLFYNNPRGISE